MTGAERTVTVYSSLPLQGAQRPQTTDMVKGIELALEQAGGKAGDFTVKYESLDDSTAQAGSWTPEATTSNARKAAQDDSTAIYIGEFNSGRLGGLDPDPQRGRRPADQPRQHGRRADLGRAGRGAGRAGEVLPERSAHLHADRPQGHDPGRGARHRHEGGRLHQGLHDQRQGGLRSGARRRTSRTRPRRRASRSSPTRRSTRTLPNYRSLASAAADAGADCFIFSGITANNAVQLYKDFEAAMPDAKLYGPDGVAEAGFVDPEEGGIPAERGGEGDADRRDALARPVPGGGPGVLRRLPREARRAEPEPVRDLRLRGDAPGARRDRSAPSTGDKADILAALFDTSDRESVLGTYSIDENGDTTLSDYGVYTRRGRRAGVRPHDPGAGRLSCRGSDPLSRGDSRGQTLYDQQISRRHRREAPLASAAGR